MADCGVLMTIEFTGSLTVIRCGAPSVAQVVLNSPQLLPRHYCFKHAKHSQSMGIRIRVEELDEAG